MIFQCSTDDQKDEESGQLIDGMGCNEKGAKR